MFPVSGKELKSRDEAMEITSSQQPLDSLSMYISLYTQLK